jgi:3-methylcrotonyl-CoA carboxylase alpha subunit
MKTFRKILIANRGEIALRIMRSCRAMGIATVAVYSDADRNAPHTRFADSAVYLGPSSASESYLNIPLLIAAAARTGADAIHPGYGFLSENAEFAHACTVTGISFIGPSPLVIRQMGLKSLARQIAAEAGAPIVPGYDGDDQSLETLRAQMLWIGFPVLLKAVAGGGGKGMRVVRADSEGVAAIEGARREALKAFGDDSLIIEKYIEEARHIEVQILGDQHGNLVHLFERDCSAQRRHQKIIEESPAPTVSDKLREQLGEAAVGLGRALNYTGAGTVEFIVAPDGEFYFIEVNTRLQVEHPVTEMITGLDLVSLQIEITEGKTLPFIQSDLRTNGHAIEARLYAEDPDNDFLPSVGIIRDYQAPETNAGLRIDSGVERGMEIGIHYDPLLAKLIAHGADRDAAIRKLADALRRLSVQGLKTNREFLIRLLEHPQFNQGRVHTGFIAEHLSELMDRNEIEPDRSSAIAAALYLQKSWQAADELMTNLPPSYRNNPWRRPSLSFVISEKATEVSWMFQGEDRYEMNLMGATVQAEVLSFAPGHIRLVLDGVQRIYRVTEAGQALYIHSSLGSSVMTRLPRFPEHQATAEQGSHNSPMPGQVVRILVEAGQQVIAGEPLLILEAMKMEQTMRAAVAGVVQAVLVSPGQVVGPGEALVNITASPDNIHDQHS